VAQESDLEDPSSRLILTKLKFHNSSGVRRRRGEEREEGGGKRFHGARHHPWGGGMMGGDWIQMMSEWSGEE